MTFKNWRGCEPLNTNRAGAYHTDILQWLYTREWVFSPKILPKTSLTFPFQQFDSISSQLEMSSDQWP